MLMDIHVHDAIATLRGELKPTQIMDSAAGTVARTFDLLDRLTAETTPEGSVSYTYDAADRRATRKIARQLTSCRKQSD